MLTDHKLSSIMYNFKQQKTQQAIFETLKTVPEISDDWAEAGRPCSPRVLYVFMSNPLNMHDSSDSTEQTSQRNKRLPSLTKLQHSLEDKIYGILRKYRIITNVSNNCLFAFPANQEFVHIYQSNDVICDPKTFFINQLKIFCEQSKNGFRQGNFVVKDSNQTFNQVSPDHSLEWLNGVGKKSGGIVGITKTNTALARWTLSYNQRASVSSQTYAMMNVGIDNQWTPNEATTARMSRDNHDEASIRMVLTRFKVMADEIVDRPDALLNIATRDVATADVEQSLLKAEQLGQNQLETFVKDRMADKKVNFRDPLQKTKALTFASLYTVHVASNASKGKMETLKADRNFTQRLLMAYRAGRPVDLNNILNHELMKIPVSIADTSGTLRTGTTSILFDVLTKDVSCPTEITISESSCLIIDGQAMVMSLGKPADVNTFGEYADVVVKYVLKQGEAYNRIDVTFDRYNNLSIKGDTRVKRTKKSRPIRRLIEDDDVPLPNKWTDFMASTDNKGDLCLYLSNALATAPSEKTIVVGGGFASETEVRSTDANMNTDLL
ncbi:Protein smg8 [Nymphon striatum]|nr:Protein smg8 [Nymphon striatum]